MARLQHLLAAKTAAAAGDRGSRRDLRRDEEVAADQFQRLADDLLVVCREIVLRRIEPVDAAFDRRADDAGGAPGVRLLVRLRAELVAPEADPRDVDAASAEGVPPHLVHQPTLQRLTPVEVSAR